MTEEKQPMLIVDKDGNVKMNPDYYHQSLIIPPKLSNYTCYLFGGSPGDGIAWTPQEGKVPNVWVRFWMKVFFDCKWIKKETSKNS